jgi:multidrug efflux pump subunit AcrA (membrane-fusion protein)
MRNSIRYAIIIWTVFLVQDCNQAEKPENRCIHKGDFTASLTESGELLAVNARSVLVPYIGWKYGWQFRLTGLLEHGSLVKAGDSVAQLDPAPVMKFMREQQNLLETEKANLNKMCVEHESKMQELEAQLKEIESDFGLKKLELERFKFESERKKEVKELEFRQAEIHMNRIQKSIELEKKICDNSLKIQSIKVSQLEDNIVDAQAARYKLTIRSPINGIFQVSVSRMSDQLYKQGDNTYQGAELALVPDLNKIKVKSTINETDIGKVRIGQKAVIRLEAFPDVPFQGEVTDIGKLSYSKEEDSSVKLFDLEITLKQSDPVLKPGMTVSCEIMTAELEEVFYVENACLKKVDGTFFLSVKTDHGWEEQEVRTGPSNNQYTVIYGDFIEGTELLLPEKQILARNQ